MIRRFSFPIVFCFLLAACGSKSNPAAPTPPTSTPPTTPTTPTLQSVSLAAALSSLRQAGATAQITATGTFSNGTTQNVTPTCAGWASDNPFALSVSGSGLLTAHNSGQATITTTCQNVFARGLVTLNLIPAQVWTHSGVGNTVFEMPTYVSRVHVVGVYTGDGSNFVIRVGGRLLVNEIIGRRHESTRYEGVHLTSGGTVEVTISNGVQWTLTEVR